MTKEETDKLLDEIYDFLVTTLENINEEVEFSKKKP